MFGYSKEEWDRFTKTERKIITLIKKHGVSEKERIRMLLGWPLEPMDKTTFRGHYSRLQNKVSSIRLSRADKM